MSSPAVKHRSHLVLATSLVAMLATLTLAGCGKDKSTNPKPTPTPTPTTFTGSVTGTATSGRLVVTLGATATAAAPGAFRVQSTLTVTGTFTPSGGSAIALTGTYDDVAHTFTVSGSDWTFTGSAANNVLTGTFTGPGSVTGVFVLQAGTTGIEVVIGTFTSTSGSTSGRFNFSISGTKVSGYAVGSDDTTIPLNGTYTASTGAISIVHPANPTGAPLATGTFNATSGAASGTYDDQDGNSGDWSGARQQ